MKSPKGSVLQRSPAPSKTILQTWWGNWKVVNLWLSTWKASVPGSGGQPTHPQGRPQARPVVGWVVHGGRFIKPTQRNLFLVGGCSWRGLRRDGRSPAPRGSCRGLSHIKQVVTTTRQTMFSALVRLSARFATRGPAWIPFAVRELPIRFLALVVALLVHANQNWK